MNKQIQSIRKLLMRGLGVGLLVAGGFLTRASAQVSVTATSGTSGPSPYTTVNAALAAITAGTHQGDVTITISSNTTEPVFAASNQLVASGVGSANYTSVTIKPSGNVVVNSAATPTGSRGMLEFIGADKITIDGDDPSTPGARNLTFAMATSGTTYISALRFSSSSTTAGSGCRDIVIKNCVIIGSRNSSTVGGAVGLGITASGNTSGTLASLTQNAYDNDNWLVENNYFLRAAYGFHAYGNSASTMDSLIIRNNKFGSDTSLQNIGLAAIYLGNTATTVNTGSAIIEGNEIQSGDYTTGIGTGNYGIYLTTGNAGATIRNNNIHDVANPSAGGWQAHGVSLVNATSSSGIQIYNNFFRDMYAYHYSSGPTVYEGIGIYVGDAYSNLSIVHNTIALIKPNLGPISANNSSACVFINSSGTTLAAFKNNILINKQSDGPGQKCMGIYLGDASIFSSTSGVVDRNDYFVTGASGMAGYIFTNYNTLASWKAVTTKDSNSVNVDAPFVSSSNFRLQAGAKSALESNGAVTSITTDADGNVRPGPAGSIFGGGTAPDIGAHEADLLPDLMTPDSVGVSQVVQVVAPGDTSKAIVNFKVYVSGSIGIGFNLNSVYLNTIGSTSAANITQAKVFYTGANTAFSTNTLYGSTLSPSGSFTVTGTQNLNPGVHNFWVAYDINSSATSGHAVDVRVDSISIGSVYLKPLNGNPAGNVSILNPMTYVSSTTTQPFTSKVSKGIANNPVIGIEVVMSATGAPVSLNSIDLNLNGVTDTADIQNIKIWYTGNSNSFATSTQFGSTLAYAPATAAPFGFNITGSQTLTNNVNYFWVTYDIKPSANIANFIDGECTMITIGANPQIPTVTAPAGNRGIRNAYCTPAPSGSPYITNVTLGTMNYNPPTTGTVFLTIGQGVASTNLVRGTTYSFSVNTNDATDVRAWIDYDDNGIYDAAEIINITANTGAAGTPGVTNFTIPCNANLGALSMRIMTRATLNPNTDPCRIGGSGAAQDYTITILDNPLSYGYSTAEQITGIVAPGTNDQVVLRVPFRANGCTIGTITEMRFSNTSTVAGNVTTAKLYRTTGNTFNTSNLRASVPSPVGQFSFFLTDTVNLNDTTNYWLAYDISSGAATNNLIDGRFDSTQFIGNYYVPVGGNPSGNLQVVPAMTYVGSAVIQPNTSSVYLNDVNKDVIGLRVIMSSTGSPVALTSLDVNLNGTTDTADISNIKIWYTGHSSTFATTTQFGTTMANAPAIASPFGFTVASSQTLLNDTNYFWVSYDIRGTATAMNVIDGEITQMMIAGNAQTPAVSTAVGNRVIKTPHCTASATNAGDTDIGRVQILNQSNTVLYSNGSETPVLNNTAANGLYTNYTSATPATLSQANSYQIRIDQITSGGTFYDAGAIVYVDWNDDGDFADADETVYSSGSTYTNLTNTFLTGFFTVPCHASVGNLRMRILLQEGVSSTPACGTFAWGEVEDHTINVIANPLTFGSVNVKQQTAIIAPGTTDQPILNIPVRVNGCGVPILTEVRMKTTGTTVNSDISNAKLYRTTGNTFNTSTLIQSIPAPSTSFTFIITDTLPTTSDTVNYWLAYDVNPSATFGNFLDAALDSINVLGSFQLPANGNPVGKVEINAPMTFVSATTTQTVTSKVEKGISNNQIIGIQVVMTPTGSPALLTQLDLNLNGTTDTADIQNIKVWYTGNSSTFATTTQFGSTMAYAPVSTSPYAFAQTGSQSLLNGNNYFWVTYDIKASATNANVVDGECTALTIASTPQVPTVTAPAGNRAIRNQFCVPTLFSPTADGEILNVTFGSLNNTSNCSVGATGPNSVLGGYANYSTTITAPAIPAGSYVSYSVHTATCGGNYDGVMGMWIDWNDDGLFTGAGEEVAMINTFQYGVGVYQTGTVAIPLTATPGMKRLRVSLVEGGAVPLDPCAGYGYGETEDYSITVLPAPPPTSYVWNQTTPAAFTTASNWTPARANRNATDVLIFNGGGSATASSATNETISKLVIANNTRVTISTVSTADIIITDSLNLVSGTLVAGSNVTPIVGTSGTNTGVVTGSGNIEGSLSRWIASSTPAAYNFPMSKGADSRGATINFTSAPTVAGIVNVGYVLGAPGKNGLPVTDGSLLLDSISKDGVWRLTALNGLSGGTFDITINANNLLGVTNYLNTALVSRVNSSSPWLATGTQVTTTGTNTAMVLSRSGLTAYGEIGIAGDVSNPLPVTLVNFAATAQGKNAALNWTTASEINNSGFEVERSLDGRRFEKVDFVKGAGNSSRSLEYNLTDNNAFARANVLYYRLKQVDFNGKFEYSTIVRVTANSSNINGIALSPNPFSTNFSISFNVVDAGTASVELVDIQGRVVGIESFTVNAGANNITFDKANTVQPGVYFVKIHLNGETQVMKLVKN